MKYLLEIYRRLPAFTATVIVIVVILYLTLVPRPLPDTGISLFQGADKIVHAAMLPRSPMWQPLIHVFG